MWGRGCGPWWQFPVMTLEELRIDTYDTPSISANELHSVHPDRQSDTCLQCACLAWGFLLSWECAQDNILRDWALTKEMEMSAGHSSPFLCLRVIPYGAVCVVLRTWKLPAMQRFPVGAFLQGPHIFPMFTSSRFPGIALLTEILLCLMMMSYFYCFSDLHWNFFSGHRLFKNTLLDFPAVEPSLGILCVN